MSEAGDPSFILTYDLVKMTQIAKQEGHEVDVLGHGFLVDEAVLYNASWKKVGTLAVHDQAWKRLGTTNLHVD